MNELVTKKDPNLAEKVKVVKEMDTVSKSAMDTNVKNAKEYYDTVKKILDTNDNLSKDYCEYAKKEISFYEKAIDNATTLEEKRELYSKLDKVHDDVTKQCEKIMNETKVVREEAKQEAEENRKFNWQTLSAFGIGALAAIGAVLIGKDGIVKNLSIKSNYNLRMKTPLFYAIIIMLLEVVVC